MKNLRLRLGLTWPVISLMIKGSLPPTIGVAAAQSPTFLAVYGGFGFLIPIASILSLHLLSRHRFLRNIALTAVLTCISAVWVLLAHLAGFKARQNTTPHGVPYSGYNAAASATTGIFLFLDAWCTSSLQAAYPQFAIPLVICSSFSVVGIMFVPEIVSTASSHTIIQQQLISYLTGFGLSAAINLCFLPRTSRSVFMMKSKVFLACCQQLLEEEQQLFELMVKSDGTEQDPKSLVSASIGKVSGLSSTMMRTMAELTEELSYAEAEIAFGNRSPKTFRKLLVRMQALLIPLLGLSRFNFNIYEPRNHDSGDIRLTQLQILTSESFKATLSDVHTALRHTIATMFNEKQPEVSSSSDIEQRLDSLGPGDVGLAANLRSTLESFNAYRQAKFQSLARQRTEPDQETSDSGQDTLNECNDASGSDGCLQSAKVSEFQQHVLVQHLLRSASKAAWEIAEYSESEPPSQQPHLIFPTGAWWSSRRGSSTAQSKDTAANQSMAGFGVTRDPEHSLPTSVLQRLGDQIRHALRTLSSNSSKFGLRVAAATMSFGILGLLPQTQHFWVEYRLVWALIMIPISMSPTSGNAINGFVARAVGTVLAVVMSYANWYIANQNPAGVTVLFFVSMAIYYYFLIRHPRFVITFILAAVNHVVIVAYELQVNVSGIAAATATGIRYFPLYILAPYRLLAVLAGLVVALFWTVFPSQISEHSILRQKMCSSLALLAKYFDLVSSTLHQRVHGLEGDLDSELSPGRRLKSVRYDTLLQELVLLVQMREHSSMARYELSIGGRFPREEYDVIINEIQRVVALLSVVAYISQVFQDEGNGSIQDQPALSQSEYVIQSGLARHTNVVSALALSLSTGSPLPNCLNAEAMHEFKVEECLAYNEAFWAILVACEQIFPSLEKMVKSMKELVGDMTF